MNRSKTLSTMIAVVLALPAAAMIPQDPPRERDQAPPQRPAQQAPERTREQRQQAERQEAERRQRAQNARQQEQNANRAQNARDGRQDRIQNAREGQRERVANARDGANPGRGFGPQLGNLERLHRERMARINRLMAVYRENGNTDRLRALEELRTAQEQRYANARARVRERLGAAEFERVDGGFRRGRRFEERGASEAGSDRQNAERIRRAREGTESRDRERPTPPRTNERRDGGGR